MITYNYFYGTARTQDHVYIYRCNVTNSKNRVVSQASRVFGVFSPTTGGCLEGLGAFCFFLLKIPLHVI